MALRVKTNKKPCWEMTKEELTSGKTEVFNYEELLEFAEGDIGKVFGPEFAPIDKYSRRVRLPAREYLLVTRVTLMDAEPNNYRVGARMVTEYDLPVNGELSEGGDCPWAVLVESGQCDLMLISYMGIDFQCQGDRVYRLLNTTLTFYGVAHEGETLEYDIRVTGFAKRLDGGISMFFFEYDCYVNGRLLIEMRDGCAGFFTNEELAAGKGVVFTRADLAARAKVAKQDISPYAVAPCLHKTTLSEKEMQTLVDKDWASVFGSKNGMPEINYKLCARKMLMIDRVPKIDHTGGIYGLGLIVGEKILERDHWYFPCHFVKDEVMAGSLVSDGCSQMLKMYMIWLGLHLTTGPFDFRPVSGHPNKVRCRGQISPHKGKLVYVMEIKEIGFDEKNDPYAIADVNIIDIDYEKGQTFEMSRLGDYGKGDLNKKIVVDFKGIALKMQKRSTSTEEPSKVVPVFAKGQATVGTEASRAPGAATAYSPDVLAPAPVALPKNLLKGDPLAPREMTWHPMARIPGNPTPSFAPSAYAPRNIAFTPFPGNPLDNDHTPGKMPLTWFNMAEFMAGKVSQCLGPEFTKFDNSNTSRSPAWDLALVTRAVSVTDMEHVKWRNIDCNPSKGTMIGEFDCPADAWFYKGAANDGHMPYSILMEIALQTSGVLTSVLKAPLTMEKDDILFRNLDANADFVRADVDFRGKTIRNITKCTGYSMLGEMGVHRFSFELSVDDVVFYKGTTSFGWFVPEVFAAQAGLDSGRKSEPWFVEQKVPAGQVVSYDVRPGASGRTSLFANAPSGAQLNRRTNQGQYLDKIDLVSGSGKQGLGYGHGVKAVNPNDWFFACHFWFDSVMPGSLGVESMFQLVEAIAVQDDLAGKHGIANPTITHAPGKISWKYRGQLTPKSKQMDSEVHVTSIEAHDGVVDVVADGYLWADGLRVYQVNNIRVRIASGEPAASSSASSVGSSASAEVAERTRSKAAPQPVASGPAQSINLEQLKTDLLELDAPLYLSQDPTTGQLKKHTDVASGQATIVQPCTLGDLGDRSFMETYGVVAPLYTGAMAKGIASADLVIAAGKRKILGSFGAGGLPMHLVREAVDKIQAALPQGPYAVNLIHSPFDSNLEKGNVDLFLEKGVTVVEASAFMTLTPQVVRYRAAGLSRNADGSVRIRNRIIGKVSRTELAEMFIRPAPEHLLEKLIASGEITQEQAELARRVPVADDIAVEADSGGHTDNRPIHVILPLIINLRNRLHRECGYPASLRVRVGAGGGVGCPQAAAAALSMGAAFIVTGTVNQVCKQSGTCDNVRKALSKASYSDICMAPAADMFEEGVKLQVLKKGTMFPSRANKLYELFCKYDSFESMPPNELERVEKRIFQRALAEVWQETKDFYINRLHNPEKIQRAERDPKLKMSLCFRWYLGLASFWANAGIADRVMDYQVWCGPAIGAFNDFIKGTYLDPEVSGEYPCVVQVNLQILRGACYLRRLNALRNDPRIDLETEDAAFVYEPTGSL
uniref:Polyunsaturated fatty acid synthase subunit C n=1 Tax=Thraustochytrium sp. (strain ATCC 26185 / S-3) TaxID=672127 RepID=PFA3_THRS2|nr:RecName: Full=Polyunsaturated fatty acid synthase subunit C; Short=PUFAs-C [Thraustochytrium sp. ATCC 26185]AOG21006.1 polyunsaturated fatty acid synthase subunit C [Thraustochytrium sp. ATCC 26185]